MWHVFHSLIFYYGIWLMLNILNNVKPQNTICIPWWMWDENQSDQLHSLCLMDLTPDNSIWYCIKHKIPCQVVWEDVLVNKVWSHFQNCYSSGRKRWWEKRKIPRKGKYIKNKKCCGRSVKGIFQVISKW